MSDEAMMWAEVEDIGRVLHQIDDAAFDAPSLCEGWKVRDVLGHMRLGHTTPMASMLGRIGRYGFNVTRASFNESKTAFDGASADEIRSFWDEVMIGQHPRKGISRLIPTSAGFLDHLVHNQDIRRPTAAPRTVPPDRLQRALELVRSEGNPMFNPKRNVAGLALHAEDLDWSGGEGPLVAGPGEALVMAASGRSVALADLHGDGVAVLRERLAA